MAGTRAPRRRQRSSRQKTEGEPPSADDRRSCNSAPRSHDQPGQAVTNVIPFDGRPGYAERPAATGMSALRLVTGMGVDEFAEAVARELGSPVPLYVYLEWEKDDGAAPPPRA